MVGSEGECGWGGKSGQGGSKSIGAPTFSIVSPSYLLGTWIIQCDRCLRWV